ncbi:hypothetical protein B0H34DRAFT_654273, partial [Crassisporium funariophilum]
YHLLVAPVSCVQAFYYYTHQNDARIILVVATAVMVFDTVHQVLITHTVYTYAITNWGNSAELQRVVWSHFIHLEKRSTIGSQGFTVFLVQSFLAMRVWRLSNQNVYLTGLVVTPHAISICRLIDAPPSLRFDTFVQLDSIKSLSILVNVLGAAGDVLIAGSLCTLLHRSRTSLHRSDTIINKLILFTVNTSLLTSLCAVASLISFLAAGKTFLYVGFFFCIGRLYTNSLLATLNARQMIRDTADNIDGTGGSFSLAIRKFLQNTYKVSRPP